MSQRHRAIGLAIASLAGLAPLAGAQLINNTTYQGRLLNGATPATGVHQIRFQIFDAPVGGALLTTQTCTENLGADGVFTCGDNQPAGDVLSFGTVFNTGADRWIELAVRQGTSGAFTILGPREPVTAAPYARYAARSGINLQGAYDNGSVISTTAGPVQILDNLRVGNNATDGLFELFDKDVSAATPIVRLNAFSNLGGNLDLLDETGSSEVSIEMDANGEGCFLFFDGGGSSSITWDGEQGAGNGGALTISGSPSSFVFNTIVTGDSATILPASSVSAGEILNEAGVANTHLASVTLGAALANVTSRTITAPSSGFALVIANADAALSYNGTSAIVTWGVSNVSGSLPTDQDFQHNLPGGLPAGTYDFAAAAHGLFSVNAGSNTFFFVASTTSGDPCTLFDVQFTVLFIPTAYGSVVPNSPPPLGMGGPDNSMAVARPPLAPVEVAFEQRAETERALAQLAAENAEMRRRLDEQRVLIDAALMQQGIRR